MKRGFPTYREITKEFYEHNAAEYAANTAHMGDAEWLTRFAALLPAGGRVLDVGCAAGRDSQWFVQNGFEVVGIDIAPTFIVMARRHVPEAIFHEMGVEDLTFADESFDGVWCSCVLIHLSKESVREAVQQMLRVLKPGGVLYILVEAGGGEGIEADPRYGGSEKYSSYYNEDELRSILDGAALISLTTVDKAVDTYRAPDRIFILARRRGSQR